VIKKWLSYRELELLGRPLTPDEAREVKNMARRFASILLLEPSLDANYQTTKNSSYPWQTSRSLDREVSQQRSPILRLPAPQNQARPRKRLCQNP
jgi:hypothetical protein